MKFACRLLLTLAALLLAGRSPLHAGAVLTNTAADLALGQSTFATNSSANPPTPSSLNKPSGVAIDATTGKVFVADELNNRVLRFASASALANGAPAEHVIGQLNYSGNASNQGGNASATTLSGPKDLVTDSAGRLWVADAGNNRVLMYQAAATTFSVPLFADRVYGQPNFTTTTADATATKLASPSGVSVDGNATLWVADTGSHRIIGYKNANLSANGPTADYVIGQGNFTSSTANTTQTKLYNPTGVSADGFGNLWVADRDNNRVLMFANPPLIAGPPANLVLGQANYTTSTANATGAGTLNHPTAVLVSRTSIWVADDYNNRVLRWDNAADRTDGGNATAVIGQATFTAKLPGLSSKRVALLDGHLGADAAGNLWVADRLNNRVLRFSATDNPPTVAVNGRLSLFTRGSTITLSGTAADDNGIARVSYQLGSRQYVRAQGTTSWRARIKLPEGTNRLNIRSVDTAGQASDAVIVFASRNFYTPMRPIVRVSGSHDITTTSDKITLTGTALDAVGIDRVSYQVGSSGYVRASGKNSWKADIAVPKGRTQINVRSVNLDGLASGAVVVFVTRN